MKHAILVISLDFELYWGVRDKKTLDAYRENLLGVRLVVPALLNLFEQYDIHATWATVGFLFFRTRHELLAALPTKLPRYANVTLSPYSSISQIGKDEARDPFHFAASLIKLIGKYPTQEIASHTFSHYYALAEGQDKDCFAADLEAAIRVAQVSGFRLRALVFPRNQANPEYLDVCRKLGIIAYRGNPKSFIYQASDDDSPPFVRGLRLVDAYLNLSGHNTFALNSIVREAPCDIPASRFLRPYNRSLKRLEPLRLRRILNDMTHAAQNGSVYHLWWHPHNFGRDLEQNIQFLKAILEHFTRLRKTYALSSRNMGELAAQVLEGSG